MKQDDGKKLCKGCGTSRATSSNLNVDVNDQLKMIALSDESLKQLEQSLNLTPGEWSFATEVKYTKGKWVFNLVLRNNLDSTQNVKVPGCTFG